MNAVNLLLVIFAAYTCLLGYVFTRPRTAATVIFQLMLAASMAWALTYYLELVLPTRDAKMVPHLARFIFLPWLPLLWLALLRPLLGVGKGIPRWFWMACGVVSLTTMVTAVTCGYHRLFQYDFVIHGVGYSGDYGILVYQKGPWYLFYEQIFIPALSLMAIALIVGAWRGASPIMRRQLACLLISYLAPWLANLLFTLGHSPVQHLNIGPFAMSISIAALAWVVFGYRALDIVPVARGVLLDTMRDLVFVTDARDRLVDVNAAAIGAMGCSLMACVGRSVRELPDPWAAMLQDACPVRDAYVAGKRRWYERTTQGIADNAGTVGGHLITLRDVTSQHEAERALRDSETELRLILDSILEAVFIHDAQGRLRAVNKPMLAMYGLEREADALKYGIFEDYSSPESDVAWARSAVQSAQQGQRMVIPRWKARRPLTGELFDVRVELCPIRKADEMLVLATVIDITEELVFQQCELAYQRLLEEKKYLRQQELLIRDLHDGVGGMVAGIGMMSVLGLREPDATGKDEILRKISDLAGEANVEVRSLMGSLESREFLWTDLVTEFRRHGDMLKSNHGITFLLKLSGEGDPGGPGLFAGMSLFRIFKETLNNVVKHSGATRVDADMTFKDGCMILTIADDGQGFAEGVRPGRGLINMRQRLAELGGELRVQSAGGVRLEFTVPIPIKPPEQGMDESPSP